LSQTDHGAAAQGDLHLKSSDGWFGGVWGSMAVSRPRRAVDSEVNLYLGHVWSLTPEWSGTLHYARDLYLDDRPFAEYFYDEYDELQATFNWQARLVVSMAFSPEILRYSFAHDALRRGRQWSYEASFRQPVWRNLSLTAGLGHYDLGDHFGASYWAWSGGMELDVRQLQLTLTHFGVDDTAERMFGWQTADGRWALTAAWRF
jgi:uncharacterized protein (TIGR02001 family)